MTEQTKSAKGYNIDVTVKTAVDETPNAKGTPKLKFRGTFTSRGRVIERGFVAQGKAAEAVRSVVKTGETCKLRCIYDSMPANDDGSRGAEFMTIIDLPLPPKQKAA